MRIAVFDYRVLRTNPVGSCHRALLQALCHGHDFTVFAVQFDNPCPERINRVRVVPRRCCSWPTTWWHRSATCSSSDGEGIPTTWSRWSRATWRSATCRTFTSATARSCGRRRPGAGPCETGFAGSTIASTPWPSPGCSAASAASSFPARAGPRAARGVPDDRRQGGCHPQRGRPRQDAAVGGLRPPGGTLQPRPRRRRHRLRRARALRAQGFPCSLRRCASSTTRASSLCHRRAAQPRQGVPGHRGQAGGCRPGGLRGACGTTSGRSSGQATSSRSRPPTKSSRWLPWRRGPPASHCSRPSWTACGTC
jgi:hypothetical protein